MRRVLIGLIAQLAGVTVGLTPRPALAQPPVEELGESAAFLTLFPELRVVQTNLFRTGGDNLAALNRLPPLPAGQSAEVYLPVMRKK